MNRKDFLKRIGGGAAFALTASCLGGCAVENINPQDDSVNATVDFTLNLTDSANAALQNAGGYVVVNNQVVVARANDGSYVAATRTCSHEPRKAVRLRNNQWYCGEHGAKFSLTGQGLNSTGSNGLRVYNTTLDGQSLRVFS